MGKYILDADGNPVLEPDLYKWATWFEDSQKSHTRVVACDMIGDVKVSTVFLAIDHAWGGGAPVLFETMVFGGPLDQDQDRYHTRTEALEGHAAMVAKVRAEGLT